jgi:hypothetical protein
MPINESNYISLQEATKYCPYTQEYLSLRARQGKLKAVKFGRNWVTKKEWLEEYLKKVEEYNNNFKIKKVVAPPENLPVEKLPVLKIRFAFVIALVFVLLATGIVFGQDSFKNVYQELNPIVIEFNENFDKGLAFQIRNPQSAIRNLADKVSYYTYIVGGAGDIIVENTIEVLADTISDIPQSFVTVSGDINGAISKLGENIAAISLPEISLSLPKISLPEISMPEISMPKISMPEISVRKWFSSQTEEIVSGVKLIPEIFAEKYFAANELVEEKLSNIARSVLVTYTTANELVEEKISQAGKKIKEIPEIVSRPFKPKIITIEKLPPETEEKITELQGKVKELEARPPKEVEVERITKIEPIKEVTKEVIKIDDKELSKIKAQLSDITLWGADIKNLQEITKKLQATPTYTVAPSAPIYIGYQGIQVGGTGSFESLGVSGMAGVKNLGVGASTTLGSTSSDILTVNATSYFKAPVTFGTSTLTIDTAGNLSTTGTIKIVDSTGATKVSLDNNGNLILTGNQTISGQGIFQTANSPQLSVRYDGSNKLDISVSSTGVVTLDASSGEIHAATGDTFYTEGGNPIRKKGEEIFRAAVTIDRYGMPSQTNSTNFVRISKYFATTSDISLPAALTGTTRVYRLVINYADDIPAASNSNWQVVNAAGDTVYDTFTLPGQNATTLEEGKPYLTGLVTIPTTDWQLEVKVPAGKTIRIFQIYLVAYDKID